MIPARKGRWFNAWFAGHARGRIHGAFSEVWVRGVEETRALVAEAPLLLVANHTSWWDPLLILHLSQHTLEVDGHAMMDAKNLRRLPFFAKVGAFGVDLESAADGAAAIKYAAKLLDRPGRAVWVFPQGRERPAGQRPLGFKAGSAEIARVARRARVVPVGIRYEMGGEERPRLYVSFGAPLTAMREPREARQVQEEAVQAELDRIHEALCAAAEVAEVGGGPGLAEFARLHRAKVSPLGPLLEAWLAHLTRPPRASRPRLPGGGRGDPR
ncbi:lysophospholipid acyltransferase family protein [Chondromyces apiculatus]|uniref:Phospholipid/glycerol acyltransferase domain-containing protein n=1 Tax=Chondromyces apiculatus DSM 436 TaxID=1192034 RepID=A0A017T453_9BACT|nr:lysophospholipid acyltransferase family protein [Chondromyces apiculatus]EYF03787.1 Hypothetical protein CAP_5217 [Chondromyces apiculatus DSM 436]